MGPRARRSDVDHLIQFSGSWAIRPETLGCRLEAEGVDPSKLRHEFLSGLKRV